MDFWAGHGVSMETVSMVTGHLLVTMGLLKAPLGMCQCWNRHGFEDVWLALFFFF